MENEQSTSNRNPWSDSDSENWEDDNLSGKRDPNLNHSKRKRNKRCGKCDGCDRVDCSKCPNCLDKLKFGGMGKKKQACEQRTCKSMTPRRPGNQKPAELGPNVDESHEQSSSNSLQDNAALEKASTDGEDLIKDRLDWDDPDLEVSKMEKDGKKSADNFLRVEIDEALKKIAEAYKQKPPTKIKPFHFSNSVENSENSNTFTSYPSQEKCSQKLVDIVRDKIGTENLKKFQYFDVFFFVPIYLSLYDQTVKRFSSFIDHFQENLSSKFFQDLKVKPNEVEDRIIKNMSNSSNDRSKKDQLLKRIKTESEQTLFLIICDEAHTSPIENSLVDQVVNDPDTINSKNCVVLMVSATPYNLLTAFSRIPEENIVDCVGNDDNDSYYGLDNYTDNYDEIKSRELLPGSINVDDEFEQLGEENSGLSKHIKTNVRDKPNKLSKIALSNSTRFYNLLVQYIKGLLDMIDFSPDAYENFFPEQYGVLTDCTRTQFSNLGPGKMILLRVLSQDDGEYFANILWKLKKDIAPELDKLFCVILDDQKSGLKDMKEKEPYWLEVLQDRRANGNRKYKPGLYPELNDLPCILIVCEKGKMGITYPPSLRFYDLRLRYVNQTGTRATLEQDLGRAFRHVKEGYDLPSILASKLMAKKLNLDTRKRDKRGTLRILPDSPYYMTGGKQAEFPKTDQDLKPYRKWYPKLIAKSPVHMDLKNKEKTLHGNRMLLVGRPQIGKTNIFLIVIKEIWLALQSPEHCSPEFDNDDINDDLNESDVEMDQEQLTDDDDDDEDDEDHDDVSDNQETEDNTKPEIDLEPEIDLGNVEEYPNLESLKKKIFNKTPESPKADTKLASSSPMALPTAHIEQPEGNSSRKETFKPSFINKYPIKKLSQSSADRNDQIEVKLLTVPGGDDSFGYLHIPACESHRWHIKEGERIPIFGANDFKTLLMTITMADNSENAHVDLSSAMNTNQTFHHILVIRLQEEEEYINLTRKYKVPIFVVNDLVGKSVDFWAQRLALQLGNPDFPFVMIMDDSITGFKECDKQVHTGVPLDRVLSYFEGSQFLERDKFEKFGFQKLGRKQNSRDAFSITQRLSGAVIYNLKFVENSVDVHENPRFGVRLNRFAFMLKHALAQIEPKPTEAISTRTGLKAEDVQMQTDESQLPFPTRIGNFMDKQSTPGSINTPEPFSQTTIVKVEQPTQPYFNDDIHLPSSSQITPADMRTTQWGSLIPPSLAAIAVKEEQAAMGDAENFWTNGWKYLEEKMMKMFEDINENILKQQKELEARIDQKFLTLTTKIESDNKSQMDKMMKELQSKSESDIRKMESKFANDTKSQLEDMLAPILKEKEKELERKLNQLCEQKASTLHSPDSGADKSPSQLKRPQDDDSEQPSKLAKSSSDQGFESAANLLQHIQQPMPRESLPNDPAFNTSPPSLATLQATGTSALTHKMAAATILDHPKKNINKVGTSKGKAATKKGKKSTSKAKPGTSKGKTATKKGKARTSKAKSGSSKKKAAAMS